MDCIQSQGGQKTGGRYGPFPRMVLEQLETLEKDGELGKSEAYEARAALGPSGPARFKIYVLETCLRFMDTQVIAEETGFLGAQGNRLEF